MKQFRTQEQWKEICNTIISGDWEQAGKQCIKYEFYARSMIRAFKEENNGLQAIDLAILAEITENQRCKQIVKIAESRLNKK